MFDLIKQQVNLLREIEKDLDVTFRPMGEKNWKIEDKEDEECPFCSHHDCFLVKHEEGDNQSSFYKCFSCGEHGDVITWKVKRKGITPGEAVKELAKEAGIRLPNDYNPLQQIFNLAADYYHTCLIETCDKPYPALNGLTPIRYQTEYRKHKPETLTQYKIGYSDGNLVEYLSAVGIDKDLIEKSGLMNKHGKDFLPSNCFIYPHFVKGRASHFTFKDPLKRIQFQLPKKYSLNGYLFYGQDFFYKDATLLLVEGENDWLSVMESGECQSAMAMIGQISSEQIDWLKTNGKDKRTLTLFDPDDAGDKYREKVEIVRRNFKGLIHVRPPEEKDIDTHLTSGANLSEIIKGNVVQVIIEPKKPVSSVEDALWKDVTVGVATPLVTADSTGVLPDGTHVTGPVPSDGEVVHRLPTNFGQSQDEDVSVQAEVGKIIQKQGKYFKLKPRKDDVDEEVRLSNFTIDLLNVFEDEAGERHREIVVVREDGYRSRPFMVDSETKVTVKLFKILVAKFGDCEWLGREMELDGIWRIVYNKRPDIVISITTQVGRYEPQNCWIFKNLLITGSGVAVEPDANGVFWPSGRTRGIKSDSISTTENYDCIPSLSVGKTREEVKVLLGEALAGITRVLKDPGSALMALGWIHSNVYSNEIFKFNGGMGMLMFWGIAGKGKSTIAKWLQQFYGFKEKMASTSVQQLKSGVGFMRKAEYYASIPMFLDELRADELSNSYLGMIRSWYDREGRTMADLNDIKKIRNQRINATLMIGGEDLPEDPATKERCIMIRVPPSDFKADGSQENYDRMESISADFSNITYFWIIDSCTESTEEVLKNIRKLDALMVENGCSNRISKVWAGAAYFGMQLAEEYFPGYDFLDYVVKTSAIENARQREDNTLSRFFDLLEGLQVRENGPITEDLIARDFKSPNLINIWYSAVFKAVSDEARDPTRRFSKHAILRAIREEPYFVSEDRKVLMGLQQSRRTVLTLDLNKCPDSVKNLVRFDAEKLS